MNAPMTIMDQMSMLLNYYSPFIVLNDNVCFLYSFGVEGIHIMFSDVRLGTKTVVLFTLSATNRAASLS